MVEPTTGHRWLAPTEPREKWYVRAVSYVDAAVLRQAAHLPRAALSGAVPYYRGLWTRGLQQPTALRYRLVYARYVSFCFKRELIPVPGVGAPWDDFALSSFIHANASRTPKGANSWARFSDRHSSAHFEEE